MAKKRTARRSTGRAGRKNPARGTARTDVSKLQRLLNAGAIDPDAANALDANGRRRIESLTNSEVRALISSHTKLSPNNRWRPDPDGSIF